MSGKAKKVFVGNRQGKRLCGYKLVGYETIVKNGHTIKKEIREPVFEGEGKYFNVKPSWKILREFMISEEEIPRNMIQLPSLGNEA